MILPNNDDFLVTKCSYTWSPSSWCVSTVSYVLSSFFSPPMLPRSKSRQRPFWLIPATWPRIQSMLHFDWDDKPHGVLVGKVQSIAVVVGCWSVLFAILNNARVSGSCQVGIYYLWWLSSWQSKQAFLFDEWSIDQETTTMPTTRNNETSNHTRKNRRIPPGQRLYFSALIRVQAWVSSRRPRNSELFGYPHLQHDKKRPPKSDRRQQSSRNRKNNNNNHKAVSHATQLTI